MSRPLVTVWARDVNPRLRFVLDWLLNERLGLDYVLTSNPNEAERAELNLSYGWQEGCFCIEDSLTLWDVGTIPSKPDHSFWQGLWAPYLKVSSCQIPFDMLAAVFILLSRAEEYESFNPDRHGRYPATSSVLYEAGVLNRPVIDEWVEALRLQLQKQWSIEIPGVKFSVRLSYDLDIPRKYEFKSTERNVAAAFRDLIRGELSELKRRISVLRHKQKDPYDSFSWLNEQHQKINVRPLWFILAAEQPSNFDRNASPLEPFMQSLISELAGDSELGMHPSYYSDRYPERLTAEKAQLERITANEVFRSRQHFIRLRFPQTYHALIDAGIRIDYSMGYSTHFGFRAGTGHSFLWYDLSVEQTRALRIVPFAFMDTTARFDQNLDAHQAFEELQRLADNAKRANSRLTTIFHNFSLGGDRDWKGWKEMYQKFLRSMDQQGGFRDAE